MKNGWRVSQPYPFSKQEEYTDRMVKEIAAIPRMPVKHVPQHASTLMNLEAQKDPYYKRDWNAPWADEVIAVPSATCPEEAVGHRNIDPRDVDLHRGTQKSRNSIGQSEESATTDEKRERAEHHFMVSPPAKLTEADKLRIVGLIEIASAAPPVGVWIEIPWYAAAWHWLKGNKIRSDKK